MKMPIEAIYEQGVLKLVQPIELEEGTRVEVIIVSHKSNYQHKTPAEILAEIAALPLEGSSDEFSGQDHDRVLYPNSDAS